MVSSINNSLFDEISEALFLNKPIRRQLPEGGRLHIERQLPFLCVYRQPMQCKGRGTGRLLLGEAAYLLGYSHSRYFPFLSKLITTIAEHQIKVFGAFLLLELWEGDFPQSDQDNFFFRIVAPSHNPPQEAMEELESALLGFTIDNKHPHVELSYRDTVHPPKQRSLKSVINNNLVTLGLEIAPIYRDPQDGTLFPMLLSELHHKLARALKRTFYVFTHSHTSHRPAHFHELGRRTLTQSLKETDDALFKISQSFDVLLHVTPVNASHAWNSFRRNRFQRAPEFLYRPRPIDPSQIKRRLFEIPIEQIEDPTLAHIYRQKQDELDRQITLIVDRNTPRFLHGSQMLYGHTEPALVEIAQQILERIPAHTRDDNEGDSLDAVSFAKYAQEEISHYRQQDPTLASRVEIRDDVTGIFVSKGNFLIGSDARVPRIRVAATLAHEIGTHVLTYHNGKQQPLRELCSGMAGYEPLQEGLAVLSEYLTGGLSRPRLRLLAGRVLAVWHIEQGADFIETFNVMHDHCGFNRRTSFTMCMRIYRGGGYTKDIVYLRGLMALLKKLAEGQELEPLLLGKISHEYIQLVEELKWRKILTPGSLRPHYFEKSIAQQRLIQLRKGISVLDLTTVVAT
jgi:uncharacterized protein (TIGR02421 family)